MERFKLLEKHFQEAAGDFVQSPALQRTLAGNITIKHYMSLLRQLYHQVRDNPQVMALATVYFKGPQRAMVKGFCKHAVSEMGHDELAMNDLIALGDNVETLRYENPLPSTIALLSFAYYQVYNLNPVGLLGYIFFLEFISTQHTSPYVDKLGSMGVPPAAMTFILEHSKVDVGHNKLMETYAEKLILSEEDLDSVVYAMKVTGKLYADLIQGAFDQVDHPKDWGLSSVERRYALGNA